MRTFSITTENVYGTYEIRIRPHSHKDNCVVIEVRETEKNTLSYLKFSLEESRAIRKAIKRVEKGIVDA